MARPIVLPVNWHSLRSAIETGRLSLPGGEIAAVIRRVVMIGRLYRVAGTEGDDFEESYAAGDIPTAPDGTPEGGLFALVIGRGDRPDRIVELKGVGIPPRPQGKTEPAA